MYNINNFEKPYNKGILPRSFSFRPIAFCLGIALVFLAMLLKGDMAGWFLIIVSYFLVFMSRSVSQNDKLAKNIVFAITTHHLFSLLIIYFLTEFSKNDPRTFHLEASQLALFTRSLFDWQGELSHVFYIWSLSKVYFLFGANWLVGQSTSVLAFTAFLILSYKIARLLGISERDSRESVLIIGLLPSMMIFTTQTQREVWKLLFLATFIYYSIIYIKKMHFGNLVLWQLSGGLLLLLHKGFGVLLPILLLLPFFVLKSNEAQKTESLRTKNKFFNGKALAFILSLVALSYMFNNPLYRTTEVFVDNNSLEYLEYTRNAKINSKGEYRAAYGAALNTSSLPNMLISGTQIYVLFLGSPYPWQIRAPIDVFGFVDGSIHILLLIGSLRYYRHMNEGKEKELFRYLLLVYFAVSFIHALGTINYGTAMRHRLISVWMVAILGWPYCRPLFLRLLRVRTL